MICWNSFQNVSASVCCSPSRILRQRCGKEYGKRRFLCCFDPLFCVISQMFRPLEVELNSVAKILNGVIADIKTRRQ